MVLKGASEIDYCVLYITRLFISKVELISKFSGNLMT